MIIKILVLPCNSSRIVKYRQYCIAKRRIFGRSQSNFKYQQVMLEKSEQHIKRKGIVRQIFCTKQIKRYIVDLEFACSISVLTIGICQSHVTGIATKS